MYQIQYLYRGRHVGENITMMIDNEVQGAGRRGRGERGSEEDGKWEETSWEKSPSVCSWEDEENKQGPEANDASLG